MKIIFFGTPEFVVPVLEALHVEYNRGRERELIGVVTQAPKPVGRTKEIEYSEVDHFAHKHKIPIYFDFDKLPNADLGVCAAYGKIIPEFVVTSFPLGILNIHPSLLPKYRGASPIQATLTSGDIEAGVSVIKMDEQLDHGPIVSSFKSSIFETDTNETLRTRLFQESSQFLVDLIPSYLSGKVNLKPQDESQVTFTKIIKREDGLIPSKFIADAMNGVPTNTEFSIRFMNDYPLIPNAEGIIRLLKAFTPWPGIYTNIKLKKSDENSEKRLKLLNAHIEESKLILDLVQLEGKNPVSWKQLQEGYPELSF